MSMIKAEHLTFSYPSGRGNVFEDVNIQIDTGWKLGLIGRNGRGKTTFLRLLLGQYEYQGAIQASVRFRYFPCPVADKGRQTEEILREICPRAREWELTRELSSLEVDSDVLWRPFGTLSNGEQTKVLLCALFLNEGDFPLIDEPTNHLDARAREMVSAYLNKQKGFLLVSHDRRFLDGCVDHILSINRANIEVQSGNFSSWAVNFERQQQMERARNERLQKDMSRLQKAAQRTAGWSDRVEASKYGGGAPDRGYVGHKSAKMMKRAQAIEARRQQAVEQKAGLLKNTEAAEDLKLFPLTQRAGTLIDCSDVEISCGGRRVCGPVSFRLEPGERLALDGKNGSGKSSLLKLLLGGQTARSGQVVMRSGLVISYVPQDASHLAGTLSRFAEESRIDESLFKTILRKMGFERLQLEHGMESLSAGQKKKALLAKSLCEQAHLYLWDEPLNYIDIYSRIQLERLILEYKPTMIFVEHDRAFRDAVATKIVEL